MENAPVLKKAVLVGRFIPEDISSGASDVSAITQAQSRGWDVRHNKQLHAKAFLVDSDYLFIGSGNLTASGLGLISRSNVELASVSSPDASSISKVLEVVQRSDVCNEAFISELWKAASVIPRDSNAEQSSKADSNDLSKQPNLFSFDFPWSSIDELLDRAGEFWPHDVDLFALSEVHPVSLQVSKRFPCSDCWNWLCRELTATDGEATFGRLSARLHDTLLDDPALYRQEVKRLLANLLSFAQYCALVQISRPNFTQVVRLTTSAS